MGNLPLTGDYVVIDFETTGFNPYNDRIIQVAAVRYRNHELVDQFVSFVNPERFIPNRITSLTGITNYRVSDAPTIQEVLPLFLAFLGEDTIVAHNASFDMRFLKSNANMLRLPEPKNIVIDTVFLAKRYMKHAPNHKLETLKRMLGIRLSSHNALDDCITCAAVYQKCAAIQEEGQKKTKKETVEEDEVYTLIKEMLVKHNRDIEWIRNVSVGSYLDIKAFYPIIRVKVKGRKKYVLTEKTEQDILGIYPTLKCEPALKSEIGTTRIMIESIEDFTKLENYILESYDAVMQALNEYKEMKDNADEEIKKYLSITK
ncbi:MULTISPECIES: 3'-5' exonuclease [Bacillus]|uniref:DNA polymerase III subunit epsilon n=2 Tax=Bacillus pseudomycoides TaxID=64104 RepID=A0A1Y3MCQ9_9BACI|nr:MULTISPECIES: 3'-5' exonuclease [Bacillus cereus group]EOP51557.1 exonuclease, DNA polymerase III, epsilon subunit [Bacillus cereus VD136]EOP67592.1 exonuclease, DNA polymerase III, epsilon subunit [Bacillus cereus VDM006]EOQ04368.1 exonuclease, DNA polymerase III, epsilon subunit [Bacillus cereus VDM021]MDF2084956.1 3'-5' exonuclease [Bacillus pseudomycoides]OUM47544.1 DNA polymerase III subunit epsilon [Bacillus pseudomycoides]